MSANFYEILNIKPHASETEVKLAYKKLALIYHPDKNKGDQSAEEHFKKIAEAYQTLSSPLKRKRYNQQLGLPHVSAKVQYHYHEGGLYRSILNQKNPKTNPPPKPEVFRSKRKDIDFYLFWSCLGMTLGLAFFFVFFRK